MNRFVKLGSYLVCMDEVVAMWPGVMEDGSPCITLKKEYAEVHYSCKSETHRGHIWDSLKQQLAVPQSNFQLTVSPVLAYREKTASPACSRASVINMPR